MKSIILAALGNEQPGDDCPDQMSEKNSRIAVIGCGSAGCHTVSRLKRIGVSGAHTIAIDSDLYKLKQCCADTRLFMYSVKKSLSENISFRFGPEEWPKRIAVIGCGDTGNIVVTRLYETGIRGVLTVALNTTGTGKRPDLVQADELVFIDMPLRKGFIEYEPPYNGVFSAIMAKSRLEKLLHHTDLCIVIANLGEGSGSGAAPIVAELAKKMGNVVMGIGIYPFHLPVYLRRRITDRGLAALRAAADSVLVVDLYTLVPEYGALSITDFVQKIHQIIAQTVKLTCDMITEPSLVCVDHQEMYDILQQHGDIVLMRGTGTGDDRVSQVVLECRKHPLPSLDIADAKGCIISFYGGMDFTLEDALEAGELLTKECDPDASVIWGARAGEHLDGQIQVCALFTGLDSRWKPGQNIL